MRWKPVVVQSERSDGSLVVTVGHPLVDAYLEFLRARAKANTIRAVAFDLKVFFSFGGAVALTWGLDTPFRNERFTDCAADADSVQVLPDAVVAVASGINPRELLAEKWQQADDAVLDALTPMLLIGGNPDLQVFFATQREHPAGLARPEESIALHEAVLAAGYESTLIDLAGSHGMAVMAWSPEFEPLVDLVVAAIDATDN